MPRDTAALPPLLIPQSLHDRLKAHRSALTTSFGPSISRTSAFTHAVSLGLRDLVAELYERAGAADAGPSAAVHEPDGGTFIAPSPPRGSRWTPQTTARGASKKRAQVVRGAPTGFVKLTTMIVDRALLDAIDETRDTFDRVHPGLVASRAALVREALARGLAAVEREREHHERMRRAIAAQPSPIPPLTTSIPLSALLAPHEHTAHGAEPMPRARTQRRARRSRARRVRRTRVRARSRSPDDGAPPAPLALDIRSPARRSS